MRLYKLTISLTLVILFIFIFTACSEKPEHDGNWYYNESMNAYRAGDFRTFLDYTLKAEELIPQSLNIKYNLACAYSLNKKTDEAFDLINKLADKGFTVGVEPDPDFDNIRDDAPYPALLDKLNKVSKPVNRSELAYVIPEIDQIGKLAPRDKLNPVKIYRVNLDSVIEN